MSDAPWRTDPMYGGMSEEAARRSYEAWQRQGCQPLQPRGPALPASDAEIARRKRTVSVLLDEYEAAIAAAKEWFDGWMARRPKGFRAKRRKQQAAE